MSIHAAWPSPERPPRGEASSSGGLKATSASWACVSGEELRNERSPRARRAIPANTHAMIQQMDHSRKPNPFRASKLAGSEKASVRNGHFRGPNREHRSNRDQKRDERDGYDPNRFARVHEVTTRIGSVLRRSLAKVDRELTLIAAVRTNRLQDRRLNRRCGRRRSDRDKNGLSSIGAVRGFMFGVQMLFISATLGTTYP